MADELEQNSAVLMVEMMATLMVDERVVWKDISMVEPTATTMVDDLDAKMAA